MKITDSGKKKYSEIKRLIRYAMSERQLVLFVGAGASKDAGMPLWSEVILQIENKLSFENDRDMIDDLVIPQYYCIAHGRKEYTQLMHEIFCHNKKLHPTDIHDAIIRFGTETIVTTNYDHLIELAAENKGEFLNVVSQDSDLPYRKAGRELIKMHGDFEHDNFVLMEDDFLHYHKNFKLIENYVKSLIGTKTVLFIGYSLNDPDVKHIFSWVKEILNEHFQNAYLISTGRTANKNEIDYYRNLGINIIYSTELFDEDLIKYDDHSCQLLETLNYLLDSEEKEQGIVDSLYENLKPFVSLKYAYRKYIERAFNRLRNTINKGISLRVDDDDYVVILDSHALNEDEEFLKELNRAIDRESTDQKVLKITEIFRKSIVRGTNKIVHEGIRTQYDRKEITDKYTVPEWIKAIYYFDYKKLYQIKEYNSNILSESNPELYLQQAYLCAFLGDYLSAYSCLNNSVKYFYNKRDYSWYFISLWNKRNISKVITSDYMYNFSIPQDIKEAIKSDYETIDLDKTLQSIPDLGNDNNQFLRDLKEFKFASDLFYDVVSNSMKASTQAKETYIVFTGMPAYEKIRQLVYDYYRYGMFNFLIVDRYRENNDIFDLFVRSILASISAPDKDTPDESIFGNSGNVHVDSLNDKDIHLILRYTESGKLRKLINEFNISVLEVDDNGREYLLSLIENAPSIVHSNQFQGNDIFWRIICIIAHTSIDEEFAFSVINALVSLEKKEYINNRSNCIEKLINSMYSQELYKSQELCETVKSLISTLITIALDNKNCLQYYHSSILNLIAFCEKGNNQYDDEASIKQILSEDYYSLLAAMYNNCAEKVQIIIKEEFENWKCPDSERGYRVYSELVLAGINEPDKVTEDRALSFLDDYNEQKRKNREKGIRTFPDSILENDLLNLYLSKKLIDVDRLRDIIFKGEDLLAKWLMDEEGFDYNDFSLSWLNHCSPSLLKKIAGKNKVRESIIKVYKEKYSSEYIDEKIHETIVKYFI